MKLTLESLDSQESCVVNNDHVMFYMGQRIKSSESQIWVNPYTGQDMTGDNTVQRFQPLDQTEHCAYFWGHSMQVLECATK